MKYLLPEVPLTGLRIYSKITPFDQKFANCGHGHPTHDLEVNDLAPERDSHPVA